MVHYDEEEVVVHFCKQYNMEHLRKKFNFKTRYHEDDTHSKTSSPTSGIYVALCFQPRTLKETILLNSLSYATTVAVAIRE